MPEQIPEAAHYLLDDPNYAHIVTLMPDGVAQTTPVWITREGDVPTFNTAKGRTKYNNLVRDPRISFSVLDHNNPYTYLQVRGRAEIVDEGGIDSINALSHKYTGRDYPYLRPGEQRVIVRIHPEHVQFQQPSG